MCVCEGESDVCQGRMCVCVKGESDVCQGRMCVCVKGGTVG